MKTTRSLYFPLFLVADLVLTCY